MIKKKNVRGRRIEYQYDIKTIKAFKALAEKIVEEIDNEVIKEAEKRDRPKIWGEDDFYSNDE